MEKIQSNIQEDVMRAIFLILAGVFSAQTVCWAEIIHLKDGRIIQEKIIERGRYYIVTTDGKIPKKYYDGDIDFIEDDESQPTSDSSAIDMSKFEGLEQDKVKLIMVMIDVSGVRQNMEKNIEQILVKVDEDKREKFRELFNINDIIDRIVPIYSHYYTTEELIEIIEFYEGTTGQKVVESTPKIMLETVQAAAQYFQEKMSPP
jgi:hypothetical protein